MTVLHSPSAYPGGNKITIATWFYISDFSAADGGVSVGAAYDTFSHNVPTGGSSDLPYSDPTLMSDGGSLIPLFEWGYNADSSSGPATGDEFTGPQQALSGLYLDPPTFSNPTGSVIFVARGPKYPNVSFASTSFPNAAGPQLITEGGADGLSYATISVYSEVAAWTANKWNVLLFSADLSPPDTLVGGDEANFPHFLSHLAHYVVNKKIWMNCNNVFDTVGDNGPFEQGYPLPGGHAQYQGFYQIKESDNPSDNNPLALILWVGQPNLRMMLGQFSMPCRSAWAGNHYNYALVDYVYTQVWFDKYIDPTPENYAKFYIVNQSNVIRPPDDPKAAQTAFGPSDIWFIRDNISGFKFQDNQGTGGAFTLIGTGPADFNPLPEE